MTDDVGRQDKEEVCLAERGCDSKVWEMKEDVIRVTESEVNMSHYYSKPPDWALTLCVT